MPGLTRAFRSGRVALVRAAAQPTLSVLPIPDLDDGSADGTAVLVGWLRAAWGNAEVAEALQYASPALAARVQAVCSSGKPSARETRRVAVSVARYLLRWESRATPFGLFAGVAVAGSGAQARAEWGTEHVAVARPGAKWMATVIERLERDPGLLVRLPVVANNTIMCRGDQLIVPYRADRHGTRTRAVEASFTLTDPVKAALAAAQVPVPFGTLVGELLAKFPTAGHGRVNRLLAELVEQHVLITSLHAPSTTTDALDHLLSQLHSVDAGHLAPIAGIVHELDAIRDELATCVSRADRDRVTSRMRAVLPDLRPHPLALDLRLDADITLPPEVAREIERAASVLVRVSRRPYGATEWGDYHQRFYERYGIGTMVPLQAVVADSGIGFPDGYPGTTRSERSPRLSDRDKELVRIAQAAVLDGRDEVVVDEELISTLESGPEQPRVPPHLEIGTRVQATSREDLESGRFRLEIVSVSRGVGVSTGRFLTVLPPDDRDALASVLAELPAADGETVVAQLSFPPLLPDSAHVARAPRVLPVVISLGEYRGDGDHDESVLTVVDLAVACDGRRLYLAAPARGHRVEAVGMHALNLKTHTPPLARFLAELSRAQCAQVTTFDWGAAAEMPFLPRLRYGHTVLAPARWRLEAADLPGRAGLRTEWDAALAAWRTRRRLPRRVHLVEDDRRLLVDLDQAGHRALLRAHLDRAGAAVLTEAASPDAFGWCDGRAHEVVMTLTASGPSLWPVLPDPTPARTLSRDQTQTPASSSVLLAALYGDPRRQDTLLAGHLPDLLQRLDSPAWWFIRFRDPQQHVRLRIALFDPEQFAATARAVSEWADEMREAGLLADLRYPTSFREMGRWGSGAAWDAAEEVFQADSRAVLAQLSQPRRPPQRALVVAHTVAIASAFLGSVRSGARWLIDRIPRAAPEPVPRAQFTEAVRLADPRDDWAALRAVPGGDAIVSAWADRDDALAAYRPLLPGPDTQGIAIDDVLTSLLHVHFVRHVAIDFPEEQACLHLARAAALAWTARPTGRTL